MKKPKYILDSYALLAYFQGEDGGERIRKILKEASTGQAQVTPALQKSRVPQMQGVKGEAIVYYADPWTTQQMRYHRLSRG